MNDHDLQRVLHELKGIRICVVISTTVFVLAFLTHVLNLRL
jgi:hypothetical protein